ncbi:MAG: DUF6048 family protein [Pseudoflavonifractor sp.]|nr:DUF6048 family protein [Pseudoflavonifractor sp.]
MKTRPVIMMLLILALLPVSVVAQRRVTPVTPPRTAPVKKEKPRKKTTPAVTTRDSSATVVTVDSIDREATPSDTLPYLGFGSHRDADGQVVLSDTIGHDVFTDTVTTKAPRLVYPLFHAVSIGLNVWDPLMRAFGSKYGGGEIWAELSLHNWIKPVVEIGVGTADNTPDDGNFTYRSPLAVYGRIGVNYNFLYNSNPAYQVYLGLRYGITGFSYEITDVTVTQGYWGDTEHFSIPSQHTTVGYGEVLAGLKVRIYKNFSLGWAIKAHFLFHESSAPHGKPWYIPGYGTRGATFTGAINLIYTIPLSHKQVSTDNDRD